MSCHKCKCDRCVRNAEIGLSWFTQGEFDDVERLCFHCDECRMFDGDHCKRSQWREECDGFQEAAKSVEARARQEERRIQHEEERACRARQTFTVIRGGKA